MTTAATPVESLGQLLTRAAAQWGERTALVFDPSGVRLSYRQLDAHAHRVAGALKRAGVQPGDRVAVMAGNGPVFPIAWLAIARAGAAMVPVNPAYRVADALHLLQHAEVACIIADGERADLARQLAPSLPASVARLVDGADLWERERSWAAVLADTQPLSPLDEVAPESLANVQFTSGTTGMPKGCMLSHAYWTRLGRLIAHDLVGLGPDDVMLTAQPFSYIDPQWNLVAALHAGATLVVLERFRPSQFWAKVQHYGTTFFYCLGAMPLMLLAQPPAADERQHRLRGVMCSGIPRDRHAALEERFGVRWREVYGTTETGADVMVYADDAERLRGSGSIGHALPHREVGIRDADDRPVPRGTIGELVLRGTGMMDGYFRNPEATAKAFVNGWYRTGDLARMEDDGTVSIVGRLKDMIRRSGENIAASEVEHAIETHPAVLISAVVAVTDALRGEEARAYVVLRPDAAPVSLEALVAHIEPLLARFKVPRYWALCTDLPRTASERVAKHLLSIDAPSCLATLDRG